jgi:hypothetical protein
MQPSSGHDVHPHPHPPPPPHPPPRPDPSTDAHGHPPEAASLFLAGSRERLIAAFAVAAVLWALVWWALD